MSTRTLCFSALVLALSGCALFSKGDVSYPRYFTPDLPKATSKVGSRRSGVELRLGRVSAGSYIAEKIVFRESDYEIGFYDYRLWTEKPEVYLRRALTRVLFEEEGLMSVVSGAAPTLDVELVSFEEVRSPQHLALVRVAFSLHDDRVVFMQQTMAIERTIGLVSKAGEADAVAEALGEALRKSVYDVTGRVLRDLAKLVKVRPCPEAGPSVAPGTSGTAP